VGGACRAAAAPDGYLAADPGTAQVDRDAHPMSLPPLRLRKDEDRRVRAGHLWIFSNEVDVVATPLAGFEPGAMAELQDQRGAPLGSVYVNPRSLIAARLVSRQRGRVLDAELLRRRVARALSLREMLFDRPFYRLVHGEGDLLPGLVVDRYDRWLVAQVTTAGIERVTAELLAALAEVVAPEGILLRNDVPLREMEGLPLEVRVGSGEVPDRLPVEENGARFEVRARGQKTGWFFDHRMNRARIGAYAAGRRVLDVFSYAGGWGIQAALAGAGAVTCVDASASALEDAERNAALNGVEGRLGTLRGDAFEVLGRLRADGERFGMIVLDPPAFIKRRRDLRAGEEAYRRANQLAVELLEPDGILFSASCSHHLDRDGLRDAVLRAGRRSGREVQLLEEGHQGPDHPVHPAIPETSYLKCLVARVA
jgi:23S rRNA (cytosine1962-C5)-methyltransferase